MVCAGREERSVGLKTFSSGIGRDDQSVSGENGNETTAL